MPRLSLREKVEAVLSVPSDERSWERALRSLPADVDAPLAATAALSFLEPTSSYWFARTSAKLPKPVVQEVLKRLDAAPRTPASIFLLEALAQSKRIEADWAQALHVLHQLEAPQPLDSKVRRQAMKAIANGPYLHAIQSAVSGTSDAFRVPGRYRADMLAMFAVLVCDGTDVSLDALLGHFERARADSDSAVNQLAGLKAHATLTPSVSALFARLDDVLNDRNATSGALLFARRVLDPALAAIDVDVTFSSERLTRGGVPEFQGHLTIDSHSAEVFRLHLSRIGVIELLGTTSFTAHGLVQDDLSVGSCSLDEVPKWLSKAAKKLRLTWQWEHLHVRGLRGAKKERFEAWVRGERA